MDVPTRFEPADILGADLQLTLWCLYELHYRSFDDVDDEWEWAPAALAVRAHLEVAFEDALRALTADDVDAVLAADGALADRLFDLTSSYEAPELSKFIRSRATQEQVLEMLIHRSVYQLKEADPHTWVIPRLDGPAKAHLVEIQLDEYGGGQPERVHQRLFATTLLESGLDADYGAYVDQVPAQTLALSNAMSMFGLHRRLRGAAVGHLGALEATSSLPCRRYAGGLRRLGFTDAAATYYDEHVEADAVHEQLALRGVCETLALSEPDLTEDIVFGAVTCMALDGLLAAALLDAWGSGSHLVSPSARAKVVA